jgi:hypothetical protein
MVAPRPVQVNATRGGVVGEFAIVAGFAGESLRTVQGAVARWPPLLAQGLAAKAIRRRRARSGSRVISTVANARRNTYVVFFSATAALRPSARSSWVSSLNRSS